MVLAIKDWCFDHPRQAPPGLILDVGDREKIVRFLESPGQAPSNDPSIFLADYDLFAGCPFVERGPGDLRYAPGDWIDLRSGR